MNNDNNVDIIKVNDNNKLLDNYQYIKPYLSDYNKNDQICVICLDNYNQLEGDNQMLKYNHCGHLYIHKQCLNNWFSKQNECLLCKQPIIHSEQEIEPEIEPEIETEVEPVLQNIFRLHNIHRFTINNTHRYFENNRISNNNSNNNNNIAHNIDYNNQVIFVQNELIFHLNNNLSRRHFYIFTVCIKLLYIIPPIIILCVIYEFGNYFD